MITIHVLFKMKVWGGEEDQNDAKGNFVPIKEIKGFTLISECCNFTSFKLQSHFGGGLRFTHQL